MKIKTIPIILCAAVLAAGTSRQARGQVAEQAAQPFIRQGFEDGVGAWQTFGNTGKLSISTTDIKSGKAALQFDYKIAKGEMSMLMQPIQPGDLAKARAFRLWVKSDYAAPITIALQERDNNGRYIATFTTPAGKWQFVELAPSDFTLSDGQDDPKDPNNKLDLDQVEAVIIADLAQMFAQADMAIAELFGLKPGDHKLLIDDLAVSAEPLPAVPEGPASEFKIEPMSRPQLSWFAVGSITLGITNEKPLDGKSIQVTYRVAPGKVAGFGRRFTVGKLAGMDKIVFSLASEKVTTLVVQIEERGGGKYNAMVEVAGGKTPKEVTLRFSELNESEDSKDANRKLDLELVGQILIMDASGFLQMAEKDNVLWIGGLKASK